MNFLKDFQIQWAWFVNKRALGKILLIVLVLIILALAGISVFVFGFILNREGERIISSDLIQIVGGISALVFSYLYYILCVYSNSPKNFKIAINEAKKFVVENPRCGLKINMFIEETKETKDPAKLNKWISNCKKLSSEQAEMQELEKEKEDIEKGIPLVKVNAKIETKKAKIKELESQLA